MFVQITSQILNSSQLLCIFPVCSTSLTCCELACSDRNKQVWLIAKRQWDTSLEINVCVLFPPLIPTVILTCISQHWADSYQDHLSA